MSAIIEINGIPATIEGGQWQCDDAALLARLRQIAAPSYLPDGVNARAAMESLGGVLVSETDEPDDDEPVLH